MDTILDLEKNEHRPYRKDNDIPKYINVESNHPRSIKKQIPNMVCQRLSNLSSNKKIFDEVKDTYQDALIKAGHTQKLEYVENVNKVIQKVFV